MDRNKFLSKLQEIAQKEKMHVDIGAPSPFDTAANATDIYIFEKGEQIGVISDISIYAIPDDDYDIFILQMLNQMRLSSYNKDYIK